jgi:hypothetical protein
VNQRKAIPENTTNKTTIDEALDKLSSHSIPNSVEPDTEVIKTKLIIRISANRIPAIAADRGDLILRRTNLSLSPAMVPSFEIDFVFKRLAKIVQANLGSLPLQSENA